jgi:hypothetical protein
MPIKDFFSKKDAREQETFLIQNFQVVTITGMTKPPELDNRNIRLVVNQYLSGNPNRYVPIGTWDVSKVTDMSKLFQNQGAFNEPLTGWVTTQVKDMSNMFELCTVFNQPLNHFDVTNVKDFFGMFDECSSFCQDLSSWNVRRALKRSAKEQIDNDPFGRINDAEAMEIAIVELREDFSPKMEICQQLMPEILRLSDDKLRKYGFDPPSNCTCPGMPNFEPFHGGRNRTITCNYKME